jgi:poly(3-hydroxybutyrate) depolymerase
MDIDKILDMQFKMTDAGRIDRVKDLYTTFNDKVDLQALKDGGYIEPLYEMMEPVLMNFDDSAPEVIAYWAKRGMVKEFHGEDKPIDWEAYGKKTGYTWKYNPEGHQNLAKHWTSFVPVSAFSEEGKKKKYPVVVVLHGGFNPVSIIDGWGFPQEAARREWIVIVPSVELDDVIEEILEDAKKLYPVDESRIYSCGFSYGGFMSNYLGNLRPDLFAAVAPCGAPISDGYCENAVGPEPQPPFDGKSRAKEKGVYMPVMNVAGNLDGFRFPMYDFKAPDIPSLKYNKQTLVDGINHWADVNDARKITVEEVDAVKGNMEYCEAARAMGYPLPNDCFETVVADGVTNYIANFKSSDGVVRMKVMCEMNMPHWPTPEMSRQIFEFFSHFSRNKETLESVYTK